MDAAENRKAITVGIFLALGLIVFILGIFTLGRPAKKLCKKHKNKLGFYRCGRFKKRQ
jgi:phospholipid/cholesterol/gamma-HCH transport system substrate-binding protein